MGKMNGRKMISLSTESSKPAKDGGILAGENGVGAMHPQDSPANTQAPTEHLQLVVSHQAVATAGEDEIDAEGGEREVGDKNGDRQIVRVDGVVEEGETERPRLEEGFYELEAIRKKRIRQGKVQYLIKWRGWPESSNTWEPRENLSSCPAVIAAFERRSRARSGKRSTRGRKRKFSTTTGTEVELHHSAAAAKVTPQTRTRRKQHSSAPAAMDIIHTAAEDTMRIETRNMQRRSSAAAKDNVPATEEIVLVEPVPFPCLDDSSIENHVNNDVCSPKNSGSSGGLNGHLLITNGSSLDKSVADSEETQIPGDCIPTGFPKSNIAQSVRSGPRVIRKTVGSARQFKKDSSADASEDAPDPIRTTCGSVTAFGKDDFENVNITEIIRPLSSQVFVHRDGLCVSITFAAKRSDGKAVTVNNDFLKANNPRLLLRFYEANMHFIPVPSIRSADMQ